MLLPLVPTTVATLLAAASPSPYRRVETPPLPAAASPRPAAPSGNCFGPCATAAWVARAPVIAVNGSAGVEGAAAGVIGGKIYVSHGNSGADTSKLRVYDIASDTWSLGPDAGAAPRSEGVGTVLGGKLYTFGGRDLDVVEIFNPAASRWSLGTPMPTARKGTAVGVIDGLIHVVGGAINGGGPQTGTPSNAHEAYDPAAGSWSSRSPLPVALADVYASAVLDRKMYVFGGWDGGQAVATTWIYDPALDAWSAGAPMPTPRSNALAGVLAGKAVVIGGYAPGIGATLDVVEVYDPATDAWCTGPPKPTRACELGAALTYTTSAIHAIGSGPDGASQRGHEALVLTPVASPSAEGRASPPAACAGGSVVLDGSASSGCPGGYRYRWRDGAAVVCDWSPGPTCNVAPAGSRTYTLDVECAGNPDCASSASASVEVVPLPVAALEVPSPLCAGDMLVLDGSGSDPAGCPAPLAYRFRNTTGVIRGWDPSPTDGPFSTVASDIYTVDVRCTRPPGCERSATAATEVLAPPRADAGADRIACAGGYVLLDGSASSAPACPGGALYEWREGTVVLRPAAPNPTYALPAASVGVASYTLAVSCPALPACSGEDAVEVDVRACPLSCSYLGYDASVQPGGSVLVTWTTAAEEHTLAFVVQRAPAAGGPFTPVGAAVRARGAGSDYRLVDSGSSGRTPWYRVVELTDDGPGDATPPFRLASAASAGLAPARGRKASGRRPR